MLVCYLVFFFLGIALFLLFVPNKIESFLMDKKREELLKAGENMGGYTQIYHYYPGCRNDELLKELLDSVSKTRKTEIWLADSQGKLLFSTTEKYPAEQLSQIPEAFSPANTLSYSLTGSFFGMFRQDMLSIVVPVSAFPRTVHYVILHYPVSLLDHDTYALTNISFTVLAMIYLLSLLLFLAYYFFVALPLKKLTLTSQAYVNGDLDYAPANTLDDEYGPLRANLKYMAQELSHSTEYQWKFLSNISHDFRSPLTSIKGYAEAILDGTIPRESQDKCLEIILSETDRLTHLTQSILAANSLRENGPLLELSVFDINEVLRSSAAAMEIQCREKDLQLIFSLYGTVQNVRADKEKIQQVIYNLLDNAIKFSGSHSAITISTSRKQKYIFVSIKDSGCGISADQIPKIWNRLYKSDSSRGKDKRGTGLGLSIAKEIIQAHGQNINVISTEGVGSEFTFSLDRA